MSADLTAPPPWPEPFVRTKDGSLGLTIAKVVDRDAIWKGRVASLQARLDAAERDAARYRLIEQRFASAKTSCSELVLRGLGLDGDPTEPLSTAIDAATQET
jgi:hypothetical protein